MAVAPAYHLTDSTPPTLLMWGDRDDYRDGDSTFVLKAASTKMILVKKVFKNAGHDFAITTANGGAVAGLDSGKAWCTNFFKAQGFWPNTTTSLARKRPSPAFIHPAMNGTSVFTISGTRVRPKAMGDNGEPLNGGVYFGKPSASENGLLERVLVK